MTYGAPYSTDNERRRLYWSAWRLTARCSKQLSADEKAMLISLMGAYYRDAPFDIGASSLVEELSKRLFVVIEEFDIVFGETH